MLNDQDLIRNYHESRHMQTENVQLQTALQDAIIENIHASIGILTLKLYRQISLNKYNILLTCNNKCKLKEETIRREIKQFKLQSRYRIYKTKYVKAY